VEVPVRVLFERPTVAAFAAAIDEGAARASATTITRQPRVAQRI